MSVRAWTLSVEERTKLIDGAFEGKKGCYAPYSNFPVGAALLTSDGTIIKGANIENASYGLSGAISIRWEVFMPDIGATICAERTAIFKAVSEGIRSFTGVAVVTNVASPISPCGMCRQVLREFCTVNTPVLLVPADYPQSSPPKDDPSKPGTITEGGVRETTVGALLPDSFGPGELDLPRKPL